MTISSTASLDVSPILLAELMKEDRELRSMVEECSRRGISLANIRQQRKDLLTPENKKRFRNDPVAYIREIHGQKLTPEQEQVCASIVHNRYTAVQASHAVGKTHLAALLTNWWYDCWDEHIVYITATTWKQALGLTFKYVTTMRRVAGLPGKILESGRVEDNDAILKGSHKIEAINSESGEGFQGEHSADMLIILEEATGVPEFIWKALKGLMTSPGCRCLAIGNPTNSSGRFAMACRSALWNTIVINGMDHPNIKAQLAGREMPFPKSVSLQSIVEMIEEECTITDKLEGEAFKFYDLDDLRDVMEAEGELGEDGQPRVSIGPESEEVYYVPNAEFQGRVLGMFPTVPDEQVIPGGWLRDLPVLEWPEPDSGASLSIGADIARKGRDDTAIVSVLGPRAVKVKIVRQMDTVEVANAIKEMAADLAEFARGLGFDVDKREIPIRIDVTGGLGTGPYDTLKNDLETEEEAILRGHSRPRGYNVIPVNSTEDAVQSAKYKNKRSELWFSTREQVFKKEIDLSNLPMTIRLRLMEELSAPMYENDNRGRKVVDEKKDIKKRIGKSPDLADGFNLALYHRFGKVVTAKGASLRMPTGTSVRNEAQVADTLPCRLDAHQDAAGQLIAGRHLDAPGYGTARRSGRLGLSYGSRMGGVSSRGRRRL